jgi:hypothetical protein
MSKSRAQVLIRKKGKRRVATGISGEVRQNNDELAGIEDWFRTKIICCGQLTRKLFSIMMYIRTDELKAVYWNTDRFDIYFSKYPGDHHLMIKSCRYPGVLEQKKFDFFQRVKEFWILGQGKPFTPQMKGLAQALVKGWAAIDPVEVFTVVRNDPQNIIKEIGEALADDLSRGVGQKENDIISKGSFRAQGTSIARSEFTYFEWGNEHLKNMFMFTPMMAARLPISGISIDTIRMITHGDKECAYIGQQPEPIRHLSIFDIRNLEEIFPHLFFQLRPSSRKKNISELSIQSILYEEDVIHGATERLKRLLCRLAKEGLCDDVLVNCACTPLVIGDDVASLIRNINEAKRSNFLYCDPIKQSPEAIYLEYCRKIFKNLIKYKAKPRSLNLIGFPMLQGGRELLDILSSIGLTVNSVVFPVIKGPECRDLYKGKLQVVFRTKGNEVIYDKVLSWIDRPKLSPAVPYGVVGTTNWLQEICAALNVDLKGLRPWQIFYKAFIKEWQVLRNKAANYSLGLILSAQDINRLSDNTQMLFSVPLLPLLEEMGFILDILVYCPEAEFSPNKAGVVALLREQGKHRINNTFMAQGVREWLECSKCTCVYSDLLFDNRLSRAGKNRFSIFDLEMGYAGALRSLERLLSKCENGFLTRYAACLGAAAVPVVFSER